MPPDSEQPCESGSFPLGIKYLIKGLVLDNVLNVLNICKLSQKFYFKERNTNSELSGDYDLSTVLRERTQHEYTELDLHCHGMKGE